MASPSALPPGMAWAALAVVLTWACGRPGDSGSRDGDADGFSAPEDCDDDEASVYPGAPETCDGRDEDCDGDVDEDALGVLWADLDGDGWGDPAVSEERCLDSAGWSERSGDCDDTDPGVHPDAVETCDGRDEDCDGETDEDVVADTDGDGEPATGCGGADCDDTDPDVHPGAPDDCKDMIDQDCDGVLARCPFEGVMELADAEVVLVGGPSEGAGRFVEVGEVTGDGQADLAVGAVYADSSTGVVFLVPGPLAGPGALDDVGYRLVGRSSGEGAGRSLAVGDVDADGQGDLLVGAPYADRAYLLQGPVGSGDSFATPDVTFEGDVNSYAGHGVTLADFDGDGTDEVVISAYFDMVDGVRGGAIYAFEPPFASVVDIRSEAVGVIGGPSASFFLGRYLSLGEDVDGDGFDDLLATADGDNTGGYGAGGAWLVAGPLVGTGSVPEAHFTGFAGLMAGYSVALGDTDDDGYADVLVSSPYVGGYAGRVDLFQGPVSGTLPLSAADATFVGGGAGSQLGVTVRAEQLDDAGALELVIGAASDPSRVATGVTYVHVGPFSGSIATSAAFGVIYAALPGDQAGVGVAAGDLDGDSAVDLAVGAPQSWYGGGGAGAVFLVPGAE
ncbi:MAG: MopE-related protein [Pseudomonadota bacterium]